MRNSSCSRLEAAGFHPFVANENAAWLGGFGTYSAAGMLRVQVPEAEAADAANFSNPNEVRENQTPSPAQKNNARRNFS